MEHFQTKSVTTSATGNWGLSFQEDGKPPVANATYEDLKQYDAYYAENTDQKVIYLTFDAGFENGNTPAILDALKNTMFRLHFLSSEFPLRQPRSDQAYGRGRSYRRKSYLYAPGHVQNFHDGKLFKGNSGCRKLYQEITGKEMIKFYRPPQGKYSEENLKWQKNSAIRRFSESCLC